MPEQPSLFGGDGHRTCPTCGGTGRIDSDHYQRLIEDSPGQVGRDHPGTAQAAARRRSNIVRFGTQRWRVLSILDAGGPQNAAEIAPQLGVSRNQTATRLGELREVGLVAYLRDDDSKVVERPSGPRDKGQVQQITHAGREVIRWGDPEF